jgi:hypothetical protein
MSFDSYFILKGEVVFINKYTKISSVAYINYEVLLKII